MSNIFVNLPTTLGNGLGTPVDVTTLGALKTIIVVGTAQATVNVEFNNDAGQAGSWQSVATLQNSGAVTVSVAARWMRVRISGFSTIVGGTISVNVGGVAASCGFASLPVTAGNGAGAPVDISAQPGTFKTVQVGGSFQGTLIVEISEDGSTEWAQPFSFQTPGAQSQILVAKFMRVRRSGVGLAPGTPLVTVGFSILSDAPAGGGAVADGNYGDVTVSGAGTTWTLVPSRVPQTRVLTATTPLTIDGGASADLSANRTIAINAAAIVPATRTLQGTAPILIDGANTPEDLSANRVISIDATAIVPASRTLQGTAPIQIDGANTPEALSANRVISIQALSTTQAGAVSASAAAGNFLRGDNTWSTPTQVTAALNLFTTLLQGLVPASSAAGNFLRGNALWSTPTQVTAALNLFTSVLQGLVPASGGGTTNFLRADATWAAPVSAILPMFDTILSPAAITFGAAFDNWNPGVLGQTTLIRCTTDGATRTVRGLVGGADGKIICLLNVNPVVANGEVWAPEDVAATDINRFRTGATSGGAFYYYDGTLLRWCLLATGT